MLFQKGGFQFFLKPQPQHLYVCFYPSMTAHIGQHVIRPHLQGHAKARLPQFSETPINFSTCAAYCCPTGSGDDKSHNTTCVRVKLTTLLRATM